MDDWHKLNIFPQNTFIKMYCHTVTSLLQVPDRLVLAVRSLWKAAHPLRTTRHQAVVHGVPHQVHHLNCLHLLPRCLFALRLESRGHPVLRHHDLQADDRKHPPHVQTSEGGAGEWPTCREFVFMFSLLVEPYLMEDQQVLTSPELENCINSTGLS